MKNNHLIRSFLAILCLVAVWNLGTAQSRSSQLVQVLVTPNKADWTYGKNQEISFNVSVIKHQVPVQGIDEL